MMGFLDGVFFEFGEFELEFDGVGEVEVEDGGGFEEEGYDGLEGGEDYVAGCAAGLFG